MRRLGRKRRIPPTRYPHGAEREYYVSLRRLFTGWWNETMEALGRALFLDLGRARVRRDADSPIEALFAAARAKWGDKVDRFRPSIEKAGRAVDKAAQVSLANQIEAAGGLPSDAFPNGMGIDLFGAEPQLAEELRDFTRENVRLVKSIGEDAANRLDTIVTDWLKSGTNTDALVRKLKAEFDYDERRAKVIARDQIGKLNGRLNQVRQRAAGCTHYTWHTMQDGRVRKAHAERNGVEYAWDSPPADGHPGQPVQCRCTPTPVFDKAKDFGLSQAQISEEEAEDQTRAARRKAQIEARQARTKQVQAEIKARKKSEAEARALSPSYPPAPGAAIPARPARKRTPDEPLTRFPVDLNQVNWSPEERARVKAQLEASRQAAEAARRDPTPLQGFRLKP